MFPATFAVADEPQAEKPMLDNAARPKIAVVLAGGGAKGAAHIGVLKALEEMRIPVDFITGTSMGAYVGGLYASGMSADEIESLIYSVDWNEGYRDRVNRSQRRVRDKEYEDRYQLTTDLGLRWGEIRAPRGVVQGQNMLRILRETSGNLSEFQSFDQLPIPYRAVATDIIALEEVVLDRGYLVDAMMASMSVPGALPPYEVNGRWLVDGGVTNNMPVDVARALGADIVIAIDISTDYKNQEAFTTFLTVADQLSNYLVQRSTQKQARLLNEQDVFLRPDVGSMETTEFDKMPTAYEKGYEIAMANQSVLTSLSLSSASYQRYVEAKQARRRALIYGDDVQVDEIVLNNRSHYSDQLLKNRLHLKTGQPLSTEQIEATVENLYALDRFELVTYEYREFEGKNQLVIDVKEKSWGPNYLNFRFFLEDDFHTDSQYALGISSNFTNLNSFGSELRFNLEMGTDKIIEAELFSPLFSGQKAFTLALISFSNDKRNKPMQGFDDTSLEASKDYLPISYLEWIGELSLGYQDKLWREFKLGIRYTDGEAEVSNWPSMGNMDYTRAGVFANYRIDTLDDFSLPTRGVYLDLEYLASHDKVSGVSSDLESNDTVYEFSGELIAAYSFGRHTLVGNLDYGVVQSKNSSEPINPKSIGGFLNLSGIPRNSLIGQNKAFTSLVYRYRWFDNDFGLFSSPFYVGASIEYGGVWSDPDLSFDTAPLYGAGSVFAGVDSPIGPIMFAYGRTEDNFDSIYLSIGTTF
ncbi:patatin-like phospholipase family protein [Vibrio anguillarum]|uniref:patatin-like phospholipase family protein n=1 Tax=Vibrio anguillarum TaxID=55601 RepID=UPI0018FE690D|nr:patatin-like phospholipase family protein [Vibrio anguillarum]MCC4235174.1 patatin-like phospholipase family protein [Vibrio anguillarum]MDT3846273.1 patatin-like phospholipase family protein [Vibrio anguillarum]